MYTGTNTIDNFLVVRTFNNQNRKKKKQNSIDMKITNECYLSRTKHKKKYCYNNLIFKYI